jgi:hypothetical protein
MALKLKVASSFSLPFVHLSSTASEFSLSQSCSVSKSVFHPKRSKLNTRNNSYTTSFVIRAARIQSKGVTLGFRAPQFQVFSLPLFIFLFIFFFSNIGIITFLFLIFFFGWFEFEIAFRASYWQGLDIGRF